MKLALITLFCALTLVSPGCRSSDEKSDAQHAADTRVEEGLVQLDPRVVGTGSNRALEFKLENRSEDAVKCLFTIDWLDADGVRVPLSSTAWQRVELEAGASQSVRVAPMPVEARSWRLRFQNS